MNVELKTKVENLIRLAIEIQSDLGEDPEAAADNLDPLEMICSILDDCVELADIADIDIDAIYGES